LHEIDINIQEKINKIMLSAFKKDTYFDTEIYLINKDALYELLLLYKIDEQDLKLKHKKGVPLFKYCKLLNTEIDNPAVKYSFYTNSTYMIINDQEKIYERLDKYLYKYLGKLDKELNIAISNNNYDNDTIKELKLKNKELKEKAMEEYNNIIKNKYKLLYTNFEFRKKKDITPFIRYSTKNRITKSDTTYLREKIPNFLYFEDIDTPKTKIEKANKKTAATLAKSRRVFDYLYIVEEKE